MRARHLVIALLAMLTVVCVPWTTVQADTRDDAYEKARAQLEALEKDEARSRFREPWIRLADTFEELYTKNPGWRLQPASLYRSAKAYEGLAGKSFNRTDAQKAVQLYGRVTEKFPRHPLADDALFCVARIQENALRDDNAAVQTLNQLLKDYPRGDMAPRARDKLNELKAPSKDASADSRKIQAQREQDSQKQKSSPRQSPPEKARSSSPVLMRLVCDTDPQSVRLTLETTRPVDWEVRSSQASSKYPATIIAEFPDTLLDDDIPRMQGARGLMKALGVRRTDNGSTLVTLELKKFAAFKILPGHTPEPLVIEVSADKKLSESQPPGATVRKQKRSAAANTRRLAAQLGLSVRTIVLDAGHGGSDPGASGNGIVEKHVTLDMTKRVARLLKKQGFTVRTVRDNDTTVTLGSRTRFANRVKGDLFVSIHVNASTSADTSGVETYYLNFASSGAAARVAAVENAVGDYHLGAMEEMLANIMLGARTQESKALAYCVQENILEKLKKSRFVVRDGGVRSAPFFVLMRSGMPGVLIELGYCSNRTEAKRLNQRDYRDIMAEGIAEGIRRYAASLERY